MLDVRADCGTFGPGCSDDLRITTPSGVDEASGADSGDVNVDGITRDDTAPRSIDAHADSGDVTVRGR